MAEYQKSARKSIEDFVGPCSSRLVSRFDSESRVTESNNRAVYRAQRVFQADVALWAYPQNEYENKPAAPSDWQDSFLNDSTSAHLVLDREADLSRKATLEQTESDRANCYERHRRELYSQFPRRCMNGEGSSYYAKFREEPVAVDPRGRSLENPYLAAAQSTIEWKSRISDRETASRQAVLVENERIVRERYLQPGSLKAPKYNPYMG